VLTACGKGECVNFVSILALCLLAVYHGKPSHGLSILSIFFSFSSRKVVV
jgi:hypothetical protein